MNNPQIKPSQQEEQHRRNALAISLITGILFTVISMILGPIAYRENGIGGLWGIIITGVVALSAFIGAIQIAREHTSRGMGILIITILIMSLALPVVAHGQGIALGIMILVFVAGISSATLATKLAVRAIISAFVIGILITLTDLFLPDFGLPTKPVYTNTIAIIVSLTYLVFILRRFRTYSLPTKIVIAFILTTIVPLMTLSVFNSRSSTQALKEQSATQLTTLANIVASTIDEFMSVQLASVHADARQLSLIDYLEMSPAKRANSEVEQNARAALISMTRKEPVFIHSIALLTTTGINALDTLDEYKDRDESDYLYFTSPLKTGLPYASNVVFRNNKAFIHFTAPVRTRNGETVGVLRIEYHASVLQSLIRSLESKNPDTIISLVDINSYLRIGYTGNRNNLFKSYKNFTGLQLLAFQSDGRLPAGPRENTLKDTNDSVVAGIDNLQQEPFFDAYSQSLGTDAVNTGVFLKSQPWVALIHQSTNTYLVPVDKQTRENTLLSLFLVTLGIVAGFAASRILTLPLTTLTKVAEEIASGDFNARAEVRTGDEIGTLASTFNHMADQLKQTLTGLEQRVAERTADLELSRQHSVRRANELQSIGEISKIITSEQKLENLLPLITRLVSESFNFYHVGIFLIDNSNQYAILQAANSAGGQNMLKRGHKLEVGGSGIVGYVAQSGKPRISLDVGQDAVYFNNPDLPDTRSEMALPLKVRDSIVGVLDVQSEKPGAFTQDDASTLGILADQIAIALENARLFTQTQQALNEVQTLYRQNLQEGWKTFSRDKKFVGYRQNMSSGNKLTRIFESDEIRQATNRGEVLIFHADGITQEASIVVPIKLRGQVIGSINIKAPVKNRQWTNDEVNLAETISERLSIALENARLIEETQRQLMKEQMIGEITGKIGTSINLKNVLQTAVEELGHAMPGSEVRIQFKSNEK